MGATNSPIVGDPAARSSRARSPRAIRRAAAPHLSRPPPKTARRCIDAWSHSSTTWWTGELLRPSHAFVFHPLVSVDTTDCIFCRIAAGEIPATVVHQDDHLVAFRDTQPQAPTHILLIPREHISSLDDASDGDREILGRLLVAAGRIARSEGLAEGGYRTVVNTGRDGGQSVHHLHLHLLGGRALAWPPG